MNGKVTFRVSHPKQAPHIYDFGPVLSEKNMIEHIDSVPIYVIDKGYFSEAFLFKPRGGRSPPSGLNRRPRKNPLFSL